MKLYGFQLEVLKKTEHLNRVAYFLDMGMGKTFIGAEKMKRLGEQWNLLICYKSKINDWLNHFKKYYPETLSFDLTKPKEYMTFFRQTRDGASLGIINYDLIARRGELYMLRGYTLVLDESAAIQGERTNRAKTILEKMNPKNVVLLSGTPTSGKYENLWPQLRLLGWNISRAVYRQHYVNWDRINVNGLPLSVPNKKEPYKNVERLKRKMREHGAVFMKSNEALELPKQNIIIVPVRRTKGYSNFQRERLFVVRETYEELIADTPLKLQLYNRLLCGAYCDAKICAFKDLINSTRDRVIVFYNFKKEFDIIIDVVRGDKKWQNKAFERPISIVNGLTKDLKAYENENDSITLVQYQAGAHGLNLQKACIAIYFTLPLRSDLFEQSKKRIHRMGQTRPCHYYIMTCTGTIEDKEIIPLLGLRKHYTDQLFIEGGSDD